jgi:hypothetical protein
MPKYRKKPVVIEATEWQPGRDVPGVELVAGGAFIQTLEGPLNVSPGDMIITGVKGERYPCKPDIFAATYEGVEG